MARPKTHQRAPVAVVAKPVVLMKEADEKECPLCIEQLDDTDRDFYPCPCGYQVCLFCYQRLQNEYNNTCPGCRQQYSDDLDAVRKHIERKRQQAAAEAASKPTSHAVHSGHGHGHGHAPPHRGSKQGGAGAAAGTAAGAGSTAKPRAAAAQQQHEAGHAAHAPRLPGGEAGHAAANGLPASANWVAASSLHSLSSVDEAPLPPPAAPPAPPADESAWPTLGAVTANSTVQQPKQQSHHHDVRRRSSSGSVSSLHSQQQQQPMSGSRRYDPARSSCDSIMSVGPDPTPAAHHHQHQQGLKGLQHAPGHATPSSSEGGDDEQQHHPDHQQQQHPDQDQQPGLGHRNGSSGFTTVEVTTFVGGARHSVCVPVTNHSDVPAFPEAATLLEMLQQAVNGNKLSSTEAAVQLVQCLRKLEADQKQRSGWLQQALSSSQAGRVGGGGSGGGLHRQSSAGAGGGRPPTAPNGSSGGGAARAPPPGFANVAPNIKAQPGPQQFGSQQQLQSQADLAAARGPPYRPVTLGSAGQQPGGPDSNAYPSQSSMHSVDSNSSLFSQGSSLSQSLLWNDSGLPGLDFTGGCVPGLASGLPAVPPRLQMLWAGSNGADSGGGVAAGQQAPAAAPSANGFGAPTPPPGFGLSLAGGGGLAGSRLQSSYNPLAAGSGLGLGAEAGGSLSQPQQQAMYRPWA